MCGALGGREEPGTGKAAAEFDRPPSVRSVRRFERNY